MNETIDPDVGFCWKSNPPLIVPISQRAKDILNLPDNADCAIFLDDEPGMILSIFPEDTVIVAMDSDYKPNLIAAANIKQLH